VKKVKILISESDSVSEHQKLEETWLNKQQLSILDERPVYSREKVKFYTS
jgi:hypothetical protein